MTRFILFFFFTLSFISITYSQNAMSFDGIDDFIQTDFIPVTGSEDRTFEAWVYYTEGTKGNMAILDFGLNSGGSRNTFGINQSSNVLSVIGGGADANIAANDTEIPVNEWVHVAYVLNDEIGFLYLNGAEIHSEEMSSVSTPEDGNFLRIGEKVGGNIPFEGLIDEVRVWNIARTQEEIANNMNQELCTNEENLVLYVRFNEGESEGDNTSFTSVIDDSGNEHSAELLNFALTGDASNWVDGSGITNGISTFTETATACDFYLWDINNTMYTESGAYQEVLANANENGCDSIVILDLTIFSPETTTDEIIACNSFTWIDGITYTEDNNTASFITTSSNGCDSTILLDLTILTVNTNITADNNFLLADVTDALYQWYNCENFMPLVGETEQGYTVIESGEYAVVIKQGMCTDTSDCVAVTIVNNLETEFHQKIKVFPNPSNGDYSIDLGQEYSELDISIKNITGQNIQNIHLDQTQFIQLNIDQPAGLYLIEIKSRNYKSVHRVIKM